MNAAKVAVEERGGAPLVGISGAIVNQREIPGFTLIETSYPAGLSLGRHRHVHAYLSFVLSGGYKERYGNRECACRSGTLRFLPAEEPHESQFDAAARALLVKIEPVALSRLSADSTVLSTPGEVPGSASTWLANRLYREFRAGDDIAGIAMEGVLLEILAESARATGKRGADAPTWLRRVREVLEDTSLPAPSLDELAAIGGVHPVHVSREFRKHYDTTISDFIRKRRIEHACQLLANSGESLVQIAMVCGFSDQSHFCAAFKSQTGFTPARFRSMSTVSTARGSARNRSLFSDTNFTSSEPADLVQDSLDLLVLKIIEFENLHGLAIAQRIRQISRDVLQVGQAELYPSLHKLEQNGWTKSQWAAGENDRQAKYYTLTQAGHKILEQDGAHWERLSVAISLAARSVSKE